MLYTLLYVVGIILTPAIIYYINHSKLKCKNIKNDDKTFLYRISFYLRGKSIKIHFIIRDDIGKPHTHPWDFVSFLIIPYKEVLYTNVYERTKGTKLIEIKGQYTRDKLIKHKAFTKVYKKVDERHKVLLYTFLGINIPAITVGVYSDKKKLCSLCEEIGYCKSNKLNK